MKPCLYSGNLQWSKKKIFCVASASLSCWESGLFYCLMGGRIVLSFIIVLIRTHSVSADKNVQRIQVYSARTRHGIYRKP